MPHQPSTTRPQPQFDDRLGLLSLYSFLYAVFCGAMTGTWLTLRRSSEEAARAATHCS